MERIIALIDKLNLQKQQGAGPAQMLVTVQLLQSELLKFQLKNEVPGTSKVAVTMPAHLSFSSEPDRDSLSEMIIKEEPRPVMDSRPSSIPVPEPVKTITEQKEYILQKPGIGEHVFTEEKPAFREEKRPSYAPVHGVLNPALDFATESPTLMQHFSPAKELHEVIAEKKESLNDRLKQEKTEVVNVLKDTPIKDLRKGIGINDRFTFVNELFRGDEAMYERSIKTINSFNILSEAEYWMNRELKFKLGWNDSKENVKYFYQLVRRRFA
jgi:hypothetical protein